MVVNHSASAPQAEEVVAAITAAGGEAVAIQADVTAPGDVASMWAKSISGGMAWTCSCPPGADEARSPFVRPSRDADRGRSNGRSRSRAVTGQRIFGAFIQTANIVAAVSLLIHFEKRADKEMRAACPLSRNGWLERLAQIVCTRTTDAAAAAYESGTTRLRHCSQIRPSLASRIKHPLNDIFKR